MLRVLGGYSLASLAGIALGLFIGLSPVGEKLISPYLEFLRPIPPIAWIPISIIMFGIGDPSACFVIFLGALFPIATNTALGVREVPIVYLEAAQSLGVSRARRYRSVIWPASLPSVLAGMRVGLGFAWMCVIAAEMVAASSGLGYEIQLHRQALRLDRVIAGMVVIGITGILMTRAMAYMETILLPWRSPTREKRTRSSSKVASTTATTIDKLLAPPESCSIDLQNVCFSYGERLILKDLNLSVTKGEIVCVLGISGSGKSTLLRLVAGLEKPSQGAFCINGARTDDLRQHATMVFQSGALFPWATSAGNVLFGIPESIKSTRVRLRIAIEILTLVGLRHKSRYYPRELSGGQQQRVALGRAIGNAPKILLLDEPFSALDTQAREAIQEDVHRILRNRGLTTIIVTHDISEALYMGDRIVILDPESGRLSKEISVDFPASRESSTRATQRFHDMQSQLRRIVYGRQPDILEEAS